jgi:hypothetical protein
MRAGVGESPACQTKGLDVIDTGGGIFIPLQVEFPSQVFKDLDQNLVRQPGDIILSY